MHVYYTYMYTQSKIVFCVHMYVYVIRFIKGIFHAHNDKAQFSLSVNSYTDQPTIQNCSTTVKLSLVCFFCGLLLRPGIIMSMSAWVVFKISHPAGNYMPHDWLMWLAINLAMYVHFVTPRTQISKGNSASSLI